MKQLLVTIRSECGLHARPAANVMKEAKKYKSAVSISKNGKSANAKSLVEILGMGINCGEQVTLNCEGEDEEDAALGVKCVMEAQMEC